MNVSAASQFIDNLINLIKDDSFGVKYQYEALRNIVKTLNDEVKNYSANLELNENEFKKNFGIIQYELELMNYVMNILLNFREEKIKRVGGEKIGGEIPKALENAYKQFKKTI